MKTIKKQKMSFNICRSKNILIFAIIAILVFIYYAGPSMTNMTTPLHQRLIMSPSSTSALSNRIDGVDGGSSEGAISNKTSIIYQSQSQPQQSFDDNSTYVDGGGGVVAGGIGSSIGISSSNSNSVNSLHSVSNISQIKPKNVSSLQSSVSSSSTSTTSASAPIKITKSPTTTTTTLSPVLKKSNSSQIGSLQLNQNGANHNTSVQVVTTRAFKTSEIYEPGFFVPNAELCPNQGKDIRLLILITSAPVHQEARLAIRQTWGHYTNRRDIAIGFLLGRTQIPQVDEKLAAENFMYGDIIRGNFIDSYTNLTLKTISLLEWVNLYCNQVTFVLKADDDMFINIPKLSHFLDQHPNDKLTIYGRLAKEWKPIRNKKSKYYVSLQQYFLPKFPIFTTGPAYLLTKDAIPVLYNNALNQNYLKLEDVYVTGIVAQKSNVKRIHVNEFLNRRIAFNQCNIKKTISLHMIKSNEQFDLWKKSQDTNTKCK